MKQNKNAHRPGYKQTLVGFLPENWEITTLGTIGKLSKGKGISKDQISENGLPCIRYGEIYTTHEFIIKKFFSFISDKIAKESQLIKKGDILFAGSGETIEDIGKAVAFIGDEEAYAGGDIIILSPNKDISSIYISYLVNSSIVNIQKRKLGQGFSIVHMYPDTISKLTIPLPPLPEQQQIAEILGTWDNAIEILTKLIATKTKRKKALLQQLLTGKKRLKGFSGEWGKRYFSNLFDFVKSFSITRYELTEINDNKQVYCIHYGDIHRNSTIPYLDFLNKIFISALKNNIDIEEDSYLKDGDLVIADASEDYEGVGVSVEIKNIGKNKAIGGLHTIVARSKSNMLSNEYKAYMMKSTVVLNQLRKVANGISVYGISKNALSKVAISFPSLEEQTRIAEVLSAADDEIALLNKKLEAIKAQKKGLMQKLLTGEVRVKTFADNGTNV